MSNPNIPYLPPRPNTIAGASGYPEQWTAQPASSYGLPGDVRADASGTLALTANTATIVPIFIDKPIRITSVAFVVTSAIASTVRVALFKWDSRARLVGTLVNDFGGGSGAATGAVTLTTAPVDVAAGWYCLVVVSDSTPTLATILGSSSAVGNVVTLSGTTIVGVQRYTIGSLTAVPAGGYAGSVGLIVGAALTAVTSTSDYRQVYPVVAAFVPSPVAVTY